MPTCQIAVHYSQFTHNINNYTEFMQQNISRKQRKGAKQ